MISVNDIPRVLDCSPSRQPYWRAYRTRKLEHDFVYSLARQLSMQVSSPNKIGAWYENMLLSVKTSASRRVSSNVFLSRAWQSALMNQQLTYRMLVQSSLTQIHSQICDGISAQQIVLDVTRLYIIAMLQLADEEQSIETGLQNLQKLPIVFISKVAPQ